MHLGFCAKLLLVHPSVKEHCKATTIKKKGVAMESVTNSEIHANEKSSIRSLSRFYCK